MLLAAYFVQYNKGGAQCLSGRVLDLRLKSRCFVPSTEALCYALEHTLYPLSSISLTQETIRLD